MANLKQLEKAVEKATGQKVERIRQRTIDETRSELEKTGAEMKTFSAFPFIGRGNIQRDNIKSAKEVNKIVDAAIQ